MLVFVVFFLKQKTAYVMRISDWSSVVCSSDLFFDRGAVGRIGHVLGFTQVFGGCAGVVQYLLFQMLETVAEKLELRLIHVIGFGHSQNFFFCKQVALRDRKSVV